MTRARVALVALSAAALAARGLLAHRPAPRSGADTAGAADAGRPAPVVAPTPRAVVAAPSKVPWLAARADGFLGVLVLVSLIAAVVLAAAERMERLPAALADLPLAATLGALTLGGIYLMWKVPQWQAAGQAAHGGLGERDLFEIENAARGTLGQILSGVAVVTGLLFAWQQLGNTNENLKVSQEGQITDRFTRAVEQLGSDDPTVRIGAIYALERIAADSERDHRPVMEVLTAFIRGEELTATPQAMQFSDRTGTIRGTEVRAALGVVGRRDSTRDGPGGCLNLFAARLRGLDLTDAELTNVCFFEADLSETTLTDGNLSGSSLRRTNLFRANLGAANLTRTNFLRSSLIYANLFDANLSGASLVSADLSGAFLNERTILTDADLNGANLRGAILFGVDLSGARSLTTEQVATALVDARTRLPPGVEPPPRVGSSTGEGSGGF